MTHVADRAPFVRQEREAQPDIPSRLDYAAVPLNGWSARDYETPDEWYSVASTDRLRIKAADAVRVAVDRYQWASPQIAAELQDIIERSLVDSHLQRIDRNAGFVEEIAQDDDRFHRARYGLATPAELLTMLLDYPHLGSIELAKLSHPLDGTAPYAMDIAIGDVLQKFDAQTLQAARYRAKTVNESLPAMTVLRKQVVGSIDDVSIIRRQAFLVRADQQAMEELDDPYFDRKLKDGCPDRRRREEEIYPMIEAILPSLSMSPDLKWLQPIATSYYAKNSTTVHNPRTKTKSVTRHGE